MVDKTARQVIKKMSWEAVSDSNACLYLDTKTDFSPPTAPTQRWIRRHLGTKSPYPHEDRPVGPLDDVPEGYQLAQLHLICRHGTRYPSSSKAVAFKKLTDKLRQVEVPGFEWLQHWPSETLYPVARGNLLAAKGDSDLYQIGHRFAVRYKDFLDQYPYDANTYEFQSSEKSRCSQSAYAFSVGLFEGRHSTDPGTEDGAIGTTPPSQPINILTVPIGMDKELAVKYACPRWLESVKDRPNIVKEKQMYQETFLPSLAKEISLLLSLNDGSPAVNITTKDVEMIFNICGFEVAMYDNDQTWCQLLRGVTKNDVVGAEKQQQLLMPEPQGAETNFLRLEIASDLDDYYTHGPGVPFNRHLGCVLGTSLSNDIELALDPEPALRSPRKMGDDDDESGPHLFKGVFKFGHAETIFFFSSFLGLYNQTGITLRGNMTSEEYANREFQTSKFSSFAANIAFEVYRPKTMAGNTQGKRRLLANGLGSLSNNPNTTPRGLVRLLVNEEPMLIPGCGSNYFCEWSIFKDVLERAGAGCDFDSCCSSLGFTSDTNDFKSRVLTRMEEPQVCLTVDPI
ncbi:PHOsphatase [Dissophora globulifera]|nr:PHOsphatase [Dissophora globulifera]